MTETETTTKTATEETPSFELDGLFGKIGPRKGVTVNNTYTTTTNTTNTTTTTVQVVFNGRLTSPRSEPHQDGCLWIVVGDTYFAQHERAIAFTMNILPEGATCHLELIAVVDGSIPIVVEGVITPLEPQQEQPEPPQQCKVTFDLSSDMTRRLFVGDQAYEYHLRATLEDGSIVSLLNGNVTVTQ